MAAESKIDAGPIPAFLPNGLLPAERQGNHRHQVGRDTSPYVCNPVDLVGRYGTSEHRITLLRQFFEWRAAIYERGFTQGMHILGGSFVDDCERTYGRPPSDIDALTILGSVPRMESSAFKALAMELHKDVGLRAFGVDARVTSPAYEPVLRSCSKIAGSVQLLSRDRWGRQRGMLLLPFFPNKDAAAAASLGTATN